MVAHCLRGVNDTKCEDRDTEGSEVRARGLEPPRALAHRVLNPARLPVPPHPRWFKDRAAGYPRRMATPEDRERESRESDTTKFEELTEEVREEQHEAAERIAKPLEPQDDDEDES